MYIQELKRLHDKAFNSGQDTRKKAADDLVFYHVTQWDNDTLGGSSLNYRGQFDIIRKAGRQILSSLRANPVQMNFEPKSQTSDDNAEFLDQLYRSDDRSNTSLESYDVGSQESVVCGVGAWELYTEYESKRDATKNQIIKRNPLYEANNTVMWDPNAKLLDKSDAMHCSVIKTYSEDGYKELVKELTGEDALPSNFATPEISYAFPWVAESNKHYIVNFYHKKLVKDKILFFVNPFGEEVSYRETDVDRVQDSLIDAGYKVTDEKKIERWQITKYIASGDEILAEDIIAGEHIPIVPCYGERAYIEGEEHYEGITRLAKDPQRLRNFQLSYLADIVSRSPRPKPIFYSEQISGFEYMYDDNGADNDYPYLLANRVTANGEPLPQMPVGIMPEQPMPSALVGSIELSRQAVEDVANPALPQNLADPDLSGKAVVALQNRVDMQTQVYQQNLKHAKRRDGEIYASMAAEVYDAPRLVTVVTADGTTKQVEVMSQIITESGENVVLNDLTNAEFDVYTDIGASYASVKEETIEMLRAMLPTIQDVSIQRLVILKLTEMLGGASFDDLREYATNELIKAGIKKPETPEQEALLEQGDQPDPNSILAMAEAKAREMEGQAALQNEQNDAMSNQIDQFNAETKRMELEIKAQEAGLKLKNENQKVRLEQDKAVIAARQKQEEINIKKADSFTKNTASMQATQ